MAFGREAVTGLRGARKAFKELPLASQKEFNVASNETADAVLRRAKANLRPGHGYATGQLQRALGVRHAKGSGIAAVGIRRGFDLIIAGKGGSALTRKGARAHRPTKIGHLIEFGHGGPKPAPAYPFMMPAVEAERQLYVMRCRNAGKRLEAAMATLADLSAFRAALGAAAGGTYAGRGGRFL